MKVHLVCFRNNAYMAVLDLYRESEPKLHDLVDDPEVADLIVLVGNWDLDGEDILSHPIPRKYPEKTFVYYDNDPYIPLLPGIYTSSNKSMFGFLHRTEAQTYVQSLNHRLPLEPESKKYLFSFSGGSTSLIRKRLYKTNYNRSDVLIENTTAYRHWDIDQKSREEHQDSYAKKIAQSHFVLCPRGAGTGSLRLFEVMQKGGCPVILSDKYVMPKGPDWDKFAICVKERNYRQLPEILEKYVPESAERGRLAREAYEQWFAPNVAFNRFIETYVRIRDSRRIPERWIQKLWPFILWRARIRHNARYAARNAVLRVFRLFGKRFTYDLSRPEF